MKYIDVRIQKYQNGFSSKTWVLRIISLSIALASVLYYLDQHHKGKNVFFGTTKQEPSKNGIIKMQIPVGRAKD